MYSAENHKSFSIQNFTDDILGKANQTFSVLHAKFLKEIWGNNATTNKLHSNQTFTDWQNGVYEVYIPTRDSTEYNLEYSRIAIKILPMVSNDNKHEETYKLAEPIKLPHGKIESEFLILIAPRQDKWGIVKGFKHRNKPGYFTGVFVNKSTDIIWKRVLDQIINFFSKRLDGFMKSLGFETWVWKWMQQKDINLLYYVVGRFSYVIQQSLFTFVKLYQHLISKMKLILNEIGMQNVAVQAIRPLKTLSLPELTRVFNIMREKLDVSMFLDKDALRVLQVAKHG